ncbi:MAG TPA: tetratricopeptide repeat protein [Pyrinomonadaceae bacterium]|nr:tetratricopeptide repeat protein [Pyrinomonadaceae bacterium]
MNKFVFLAVVLLVLFPSYQVQAQTASSKTLPPPERNAEAQSLYEEGMKRLEMGQVSEAVDRFQRALNIDPEYADAYSGLGRGLFKLKQWENAVGPLRRAIELKARERERDDALQKKRRDLVTVRTSQREEPVASRLRVVTQRNVNKPLPAARFNKEATFGSVLEPLPPTKTVVHANTRLEILQDDPPPLELHPKAAAEAADVAIALNVEPSPPPVDVATVPAEAPASFTEKTALTKTYELIEKPKTFIAVPEPSSHSIVVDGPVKHPGTKSLKSDAIPLAAVLAEAQPLVNTGKVTVVRDGVNQVLETELGHTADMNFLVQPGDVVTLHPQVAEFLYIGGKVKFPGEKPYRVGLTLLQIIITAGGATSNAKIAEISRDDGELVATRFDLKAIESGKAADPIVKARDRIILR